MTQPTPATTTSPALDALIRSVILWAAETAGDVFAFALHMGLDDTPAVDGWYQFVLEPKDPVPYEVLERAVDPALYDPTLGPDFPDATLLCGRIALADRDQGAPTTSMRCLKMTRWRPCFWLRFHASRPRPRGCAGRSARSARRSTR